MRHHSMKLLPVWSAARVADLGIKRGHKLKAPGRMNPGTPSGGESDGCYFFRRAGAPDDTAPKNLR